MHYTTLLCETYCDFFVLTTCISRLNCVIQKVFKRVDLDIGAGNLYPQSLHLLLLQGFENHYQELQRPSDEYTIGRKHKITDLDCQQFFSNDFDQQLCPLQRSGIQLMKNNGEKNTPLLHFCVKR